jgi:hypothetical protein
LSNSSEGVSPPFKNENENCFLEYYDIQLAKCFPNVNFLVLKMKYTSGGPEVYVI